MYNDTEAQRNLLSSLLFCITQSTPDEACEYLLLTSSYDIVTLEGFCFSCTHVKLTRKCRVHKCFTCEFVEYELSGIVCVYNVYNIYICLVCLLP